MASRDGGSPNVSTLHLPPLILGTMGRRQQTDDERERLFAAALDRGITAFDTAPLYDFGNAEAQLGRAISRLPREEIQLLTKVGLNWDGAEHGDVLFQFQNRSGGTTRVRKDSRPSVIRRDVHASLKRLGVDCLDLVQVHHPDTRVPLTETMGALLDLRQEGKLRHIGVSNFTPAQIVEADEALGNVPLATVQQDYSLVRRNTEHELLPLCRERGIGVIVYSPLAEGLLAGRKTDRAHAAGQRVADTVSAVLDPMAARYGVSGAAVALAWVIAQPGVRAAITGVSTLKQLDEQLEVRSLSLDAADLSMLRDAFSPVQLPYDWEAAPGGARALARRVKRVLVRVAKRIKPTG